MPVLEGWLTDADTGVAVPYTPVTVNAHPTSSDEKGYFRFELPAGTYTLRVLSPVYAPEFMTVNVPGRINIPLRRITL